MPRPAQALINLSALRHNASLARELAGEAQVMAVVKANAYGHGAVLMAQTLAPLVDAFAVASVEEAIELRAAGIARPILLLEGVFEAADLRIAADADLWVTIDNATQLDWLESASLPQPLQCWLKIDTGMHRLGVPCAETSAFHQRLAASPNSRGHPVMTTHFARADEPDQDMTHEQLARFDAATSGLPGARSAANSPALLAWPQTRYEWVRPGYMLWGNSPFGTTAQANADRLRPVMTLTSKVISLRKVSPGETVGYGGSWTATRESTIATVTIGYGDGYPRTADNGTPVLINGQRAPLAGRVSMDMITVDVTDLGPVAIGDPVTLWGEGLPVAEVAGFSATIGYELLTRMPPRPPRIVVQS